MGWRDEVNEMIVKERDRPMFSAPNGETEWVYWCIKQIPKQVNRDTALAQLIERVIQLEQTLGLEYQRHRGAPAKSIHRKRAKKHDKKV